MPYLRRSFALAAVLLFGGLIAGCSMKASDFEGTEPRFRIEEYFLGETRAWGLFEDRFGNLRRQFVVDITGRMEGDTIILDERFQYADGETDQRIWRIRKFDEHTYEGRADDIVGVARGESHGNALNWSYDMDLDIGDSSLRVHFNDWMFLQPDGVVLNRAKVSKWGIAIGEVTLAFTKAEAKAQASLNELARHSTFGAARQAANR